MIYSILAWLAMLFYQVTGHPMLGTDAWYLQQSQPSQAADGIFHGKGHNTELCRLSSDASRDCPVGPW